MRTRQELDEAFTRVGFFLNQADFEDDETLQVIYEVLRWVDGYDWQSTVGPYLPEVVPATMVEPTTGIDT